MQLFLVIILCVLFLFYDFFELCRLALHILDCLLQPLDLVLQPLDLGFMFNQKQFLLPAVVQMQLLDLVLVVHLQLSSLYLLDLLEVLQFIAETGALGVAFCQLLFELQLLEL